MNSKILDKLVSWLSILAFVYTITTSGLIDFSWSQPINDFLNKLNEDWIRIVVAFSMLLLIIFFLLYKKSYVDLYETLWTMAENNKLHPIRARVIVTYKYLKNRKNRFKIKKAHFTYNVLSKNTEGVDVAYDLEFEIKPGLLSILLEKINRSNFSFYFITNDISQLDVNECSFQLNNEEKQFLSPVIHDVTTKGRGEDRIRKYSGLNEIVFCYPPKIRYGDVLTYRFSYICRNNLSIDEVWHSFVIIPENYSTKINEVDIEVKSECANLDKLELQRFYKRDIVIASSFKRTEEEKLTSSYRLAEKIKPQKESCYFIQFDYHIK